MLYETAGEISEVRFSPDGTYVAFLELPNAGWIFGHVSVIDLAGKKRALTPVRLIHHLVWSPDGSELWFSLEAEKDYALHAVSLSGRERLLMRSAHRPALHDALPDGRLLLDLSDFRWEVAGLEPGQSRERGLSWSQSPEAYDISADGKAFVFCVGLPPVTYFGTMDGAPPVRLGDGCPSGLSPDGRWVAVTDAGGNTLSLLPTGAGEIKRPAAGTVRYYFDVRWLPDNRRILFSGSEEGRPRRLFLQEVDGGSPRAVTPEGISTDYAFPSPDGRSVAAGSDWHQSPYALYSLDGGEPRPIPGLEKGEQPLRFDADGSHLFVRVGEKPDVLAARVVHLDLRSGRREPWKEIAPADPAGFLGVNYLFLTPDGRGHLYTYIRQLSTLHLVEGLR
jgi:Tol biopolymer transport system component